jgi:hypothetical protein
VVFKGATLTFAIDPNTKITLHEGKPIAVGDWGIVKVKATKHSTAAALQTHPADFALPGLLDLRFGPSTPAAIGLTLWGSAQIAEATRGAVQSIPREQHDAASALGFSWVGRHRDVILPQAFRRLLSPLVSLLVNVRDLRRRDGDLLRHLVPAHAARGVAGAASRVDARPAPAGRPTLPARVNLHQ